MNCCGYILWTLGDRGLSKLIIYHYITYYCKHMIAYYLKSAVNKFCLWQNSTMKTEFRNNKHLTSFSLILQMNNNLSPLIPLFLDFSRFNFSFLRSSILARYLSQGCLVISSLPMPCYSNCSRDSGPHSQNWLFFILLPIPTLFWNIFKILSLSNSLFFFFQLSVWFPFFFFPLVFLPFSSLLYFFLLPLF